MSAPTRRAGSARAGRGGLTTRHARESYAPCLTRFVLQQTWAACYGSKRPLLLLFAIARSLTDRRYPRGASLTRHPTAEPTMPVGARPGRGGSLRIAQHHDRIARGAHEVVAFFVNPAVLAVVKAKLLEPVSQVPIAASGHAAADPPSSVMNARRVLIQSPRRRAPAAEEEFRGQAP